MSADAWQICPQCLVLSQKKQAQKVKILNETYGKVSSEKWLKMKDEADNTGIKPSDETLREDYEIGTDKSGKFYVSYAAHCSACGFRHSFKHEERLEVSQ